MESAPILELHVKPTYAVCIPQRDPRRRKMTELQKANAVNLRLAHRKDPVTGEKVPGGKTLSAKAVRRLTNAVNWLVASAKEKHVFNQQTGKNHRFRVNFVTLTLPTLDHNVTDHEFKAKLLHNFINTCSQKYGLRNYVWKVEAQANGNIHAHFTTDTFIHWKDLRRVWNRILQKNGIIEKYTEKHAALSFDEYAQLYNPDGKKDLDLLRRSFAAGVESGWTDPNTTDVHAVYKINDVAAYLAKYMSKKEADRREIAGRLWGCSYNLSESNKLVIEICGNVDNDVLQPLFHDDVKYKQIEVMNKVTGISRRVGEIFFFRLRDWGKILRGRLLQHFNEHRFNIRHAVDVRSIRSLSVPDLSPPPLIEIPVALSAPVASIPF